jgi:hypothetical protein
LGKRERRRTNHAGPLGILREERKKETKQLGNVYLGVLCRLYLIVSADCGIGGCGLCSAHIGTTGIVCSSGCGSRLSALSARLLWTGDRLPPLGTEPARAFKPPAPPSPSHAGGKGTVSLMSPILLPCFAVVATVR